MQVTIVQFAETRVAMLRHVGSPQAEHVNLEEKQLEVHRDPQGDTYSRVELLRPGQTITPLAFPELTLAVADIL
jgi:Uma2 family endonuclease